jgi:hypothetical protein
MTVKKKTKILRSWMRRKRRRGTGRCSKISRTKLIKKKDCELLFSIMLFFPEIMP